MSDHLNRVERGDYQSACLFPHLSHGETTYTTVLSASEKYGGH